jgi:hypothetical protein
MGYKGAIRKGRGGGSIHQFEGRKKHNPNLVETGIRNPEVSKGESYDFSKSAPALRA